MPSLLTLANVRFAYLLISLQRRERTKASAPASCWPIDPCRRKSSTAASPPSSTTTTSSSSSPRSCRSSATARTTAPVTNLSTSFHFVDQLVDAQSLVPSQLRSVVFEECSCLGSSYRSTPAWISSSVWSPIAKAGRRSTNRPKTHLTSRRRRKVPPSSPIQSFIFLLII